MLAFPYVGDKRVIREMRMNLYCNLDLEQTILKGGGFSLN
jgi:hypothetical protein